MESTKSRGLWGRDNRMVGRDAELARLKAAMQAARLGKGQVAFVVGEAGLGKSRLVAELRKLDGDGDAVRSMPAPAGYWLTGRCRESTATIGFAPFVELLRLHFGWQPNAAPAQRVAAIAGGLADLVQRGDLAAGSADEIAAVLGALYAVQFSDLRDDLLRHADPAQVRHRSLMALAALLEALARQRLLVLVLEDLHWADPASIDLVGELLTRLAGTRLFLLCVYRPGDSHACVRLPALAARRTMEPSTEIALRELSRADLYRLVDGLFERHQLSNDILERIFTHSQGNPYFAEEIVRALIDAGAVVRDGQAWCAAPNMREILDGELVLSPGISNLLLSRIDRVDRSLRLLLQSAAVLGSSFDLRVLAAVQEAPDVERAMHELEQKGFVLCERQTPYAEYTFRHALLHDAVYATLPAERRAGLHARAAQAIVQLLGEEDESQVEQLARHYLHTEEHAEAVRWLLRAGAKARRSFLNDQACRYFELALERCEVLDPDETAAAWQETRAEVWLQLGRTYFSNGEFLDAENAFTRARELGEAAGWSTGKLIDLTYWLGEALFWQGKLEDVESEASRALERTGDGEQSLANALMLSHLAVATYSLARYSAFAAIIERLEPIIQALPFSEVLSPAFDHVINHHMIHEKAPESTRMWIDTLATRAATNRDLNSLAKAKLADSTLHFNCGDMGTSHELAKHALDIVVKTGERTLHFSCLLRLAEVASVAGDLGAARDFARQGLDVLAEEQGHNAVLPSLMAAILLGAGQQNRAGELLQDAIQSAHMPNNWRQHSLLWLARAQLAAGQHEMAARTCRTGLALGKPEFIPFLTLPLFRSMLAGFLAALDAALDDPAGFRTTCEDVRQSHTHFASPEFQAWYLHPAVPDDLPHLLVEERFAGALPDDWQWIAPGSGATLSTGDGLHIMAAEACDLWHLNFQAPRLVRSIEGDFAIEAICRCVEGGALPMGGLCLWANNADFIRLDTGAMGINEVTLAGSMANKDRLIGRGRLVGDRLHLRLERRGDRVRALCRADGGTWFLVGEADWIWPEALLAGPFVVGMVDRTVYPGAAPNGGAMHFESLRIWQA